jgi:hypothetical protein
MRRVARRNRRDPRRSDRYLDHLTPPAFLAPGIVDRILGGSQPVSPSASQPVDLSVEDLIERIGLPIAWDGPCASNH